MKDRKKSLNTAHFCGGAVKQCGLFSPTGFQSLLQFLCIWGIRTGRGINRKALVFLHSLAYVPTKASACSAAGKLRSLKFQQEQNENCRSLLQIHRMNRSSWWEETDKPVEDFHLLKHGVCRCCLGVVICKASRDRSEHFSLLLCLWRTAAFLCR